jgi:anion-transporting  ArsA/GET3 family ATPase
VGKTTVAAVLGLIAASRGLRTIVAEVAARDDVSRTLAGAAPDDAAPERAIFAEREVVPGLHHISIDPQAAMREYLVDQLPSRSLAGVLGGSSTFGLLVAATPGLSELLTIGKVWELAQPGRRTPGAAPYDLVILDAPATGHGVAILEAPRTFADAARIGPIARQGRTIAQMLSDPSRTGVVAVTTPEEMPVNETLGLRTSLRDRLGLDTDLVVANRMLPDRFRTPEARTLAAAAPTGPIRAALGTVSRSRTQRAQVGRLRRALDGVAVRTLPFSFSASLDAAALDALASRLGRSV